MVIREQTAHDVGRLFAGPGPELRVRLLGGFRIERSDDAEADITWERPSGKALVKLLATEPSHRLHREQILDILWPDLPPDPAAAALRKALHYARHALEPQLAPRSESRYLALRDHMLELGGPVWVDANYFEAAAEAALRGNTVADFEAAVAAYGGDLLPEDRYADWAVARRDHLAALFLRLLAGLAGELERHAAYAEAAERLQQALQHDPVQEDLHRRLMRLYARIGTRHDALRQYHTCRAVLQRELDAEPEPETEHLYQAILAGGETFSGAPSPEPGVPTAIRRVADTPFVGRSRALDLLLGEMHRAEAGVGSLALVGGETGVGKTRLAEEFARRVQGHGTTVLWGAAYQQEGSFPYGPFIEAVEGHLSRLPAARRLALREAYPDLCPLLPSLKRTPGASSGGHGERGRLFQAIADLLRELAPTLLLVLDDLHWADDQGLQLLAYLARLAPRNRWLLVGTYREEDVEPGSSFQQFIATAVRRQWGARIYLMRLSRRECDQLIRACFREPIGPEAADQLYALSQGNPLFLREAADSLRDQGAILLTNGQWELSGRPAGVPTVVRELVAARVDRLGEPVRRVLGLSAVVGTDFSFRMLRDAAEVTGVADDRGLLDALDIALAACVIEERDGGYAFRHPLYREALYARLSQVRRQYLHAGVALSMERAHPEDVEGLAHHYAQSDQDAKAAFYLERAGDRAREVYANGAAIAHYAAARERVLRASADNETLSRLDGAIGDVRLLMGDFAAAQQSFAAARQETAVPARRAELWGKESATYERRGAYRQALAVLGEAEAEVGREGQDAVLIPAARAALAIARGVVHYRLGEYREASVAAAAGLALLPGTGGREERFEQARAHNLLGNIAYAQGNFLRAETEYRHALDTRAAIGDQPGTAATLGNLGNIAYFSGSYDQAADYHRRALGIQQRVGEQKGVADSLMNLGNVAQRQGRYAEAEEDYRHCLTIYGSLQDQQGLAAGSYNLGEALLYQDALDAAEEQMRGALAVWTEIEDLYGQAAALSGLAEAARRRGDLVGAEEHCRKSLGIREDIGDRPGMAECWLALGEIAGARGELRAAGGWLRRARRLARDEGATEVATFATLGLARIHLSAGHPGIAAIFAHRGHEMAEKHGLARALDVAGSLDKDISSQSAAICTSGAR